ncbi:hypothetical protein [Sulfurimonas sp.]
MYHEMNKIINMQTFSYRSQLYGFLGESNEHIINEVGLIARKFKANYVAIGKHTKKKVPTAKWSKLYKKLYSDGISLFFKLMGNVNMAHQRIFFQCNLIYLAEKKLLLLEEIPSKGEDRLDNNFALLVKSIETFDSTDKSNLLLFNRLRNVLCHTSIKQSANIFNEKFLDELVDLCDNIDSLLHLVGTKYAKEIGNILDENITAYLDKDEYKLNPKHKEMVNA